MRKWSRPIAVAASLIALPLIAAAIASNVIDPNDYKPQIAAAVRAATGRELTLDGTLRVAASLWPTIEISDVKLANLHGGSRPDMARVEKIEAQLSLWGLLWRRVEVTSLTLVGPNILFELVDGKPNWVFRTDGQPGAIRPDAGDFDLPIALSVRDFRVRNGMITSRMPARTNVLGIRSLRLQHGADDGPFQLSAIFVYSDFQPFSLSASAQPTGRTTDPWAAQAEFTAYDTRAVAKGTVTLTGEYDLQVDATSNTLEKLNALYPDMRLPPLHKTSLTTHLMNGPVHGDLPIVGETVLHIGSADLSNFLSGLKFGVVDVSLSEAGGLASVTGRGSIAGQPLSLNGTIGVPKFPDGRASVPIDLTAQIQSGSDNAAKNNVSLKGRLGLDTGSFDGLDAALKLSAPALADLRTIVSATLPALTDVSLNGKLLVPANAGSLTLSGGKLSSREGDLAGDATIGLGPVLTVKGRFHSNKVDTDELLKALGIEMNSGAASPRRSAGLLISDTPLPWAMLRGPAIDLSAGIGVMKFQQQDWRNVELAVNLKDGRLSVGQLKLALPAGALEASLMADASADVVPVSLTLHSPGVPLALIARYAGFPDEASGALRVDAQLRAAGRSPHEIAASLSGPLNVTMVGGKMSNAALNKLASASLQALNITVPDQGETDIHCFGLLGSFDKGIGRFGTIALGSTWLELAGSGQVDLRTEAAALKLHPMAQISGSPVSVPVVVEGPLRDLQGRLDASGLDQVGLLIDALFGGDKPATCSEAGLVAPGPEPR